MSRSNPSDSLTNPSTRWFEWSGSRGVVEWFDKEKVNAKGEKGDKVEVPGKFSFLLLDTLYSVKGWHDPSQSGIYSNGVRDTRTDQMTVKAFKGGTLAEGLYGEIKDRVKAQGGKFSFDLYIAYKDGAGLKIGGFNLQGAAGSAWMDFAKDNKNALNTHAVMISGFDEGQKGSVKFKTPKFVLMTVTDTANDAAIELDKELQVYLSAYLKRNKAESQQEYNQEPEQEDPETEARRSQAAEWEAANEEDRRQRAGGDTKLRELANRNMDDLDDVPF